MGRWRPPTAIAVLLVTLLALRCASHATDSATASSGSAINSSDDVGGKTSTVGSDAWTPTPPQEDGAKTHNQTPWTSDGSSDGLSTGAIVGLAVGAAAAIAVAVVVALRGRSLRHQGDEPLFLDVGDDANYFDYAAM